MWHSFCHISSTFRYIESWKRRELHSSLRRKLQEIWKNEGHIHQRGRCELFGFMHKTLLNPLLRAEMVIFSHFLRTDLQNLVRKNFFKDFSDTLWIENMFKRIRAINRTNSEVIWTRICEDIDTLSKTPANPPPKKKKFPYDSEEKFWTQNQYHWTPKNVFETFF